MRGTRNCRCPAQNPKNKITMKKIFIPCACAAFAASLASGQGIVAGWDFADVPSLSTTVNGYSAEKTTSSNNGNVTSGSIIADGTFGSTNLTQDTEVFFSANGNAGQFAGFDTTTSDLFGGGETGQQSLNFDNHSSSFDVVFGFTSAYNVVIDYDLLLETSSAFGGGDIIDIYYGASDTSTIYNVGAGDYFFTGSAGASWYQSTGNAGGAVSAFNSDQTNGTIDLSSATTDEASAISYVRFSFSGLTAGERVGLDNVRITGTAVPEPSAFAAIAGLLALGFVAVRRRK